MSRTYVPKVKLKPKVNLNSLSAQLQTFKIFFLSAGGEGGGGLLQILSETGKTRNVGFRSY